MPFRRSLLLLLAVPLALASPAQAGYFVVGSDLTRPANVAESHPRDWSAFNSSLGGAAPGHGVVVPVQGEVVVAKLKGKIIPADAVPDRIPPVVMHIVVLRPRGGGQYELMVSTADLPLPFKNGNDDPQQVNTHVLQERDARICVKPGDYVALATSGGFGNAAEGGFPDGPYADGVAFGMFSRTTEAAHALFEQPAGADTWQVGDTEPFTDQKTNELLLQAVIGTREHARHFCRTDEEKAENLPNPGQGGAPVAPPNPTPTDPNEPLPGKVSIPVPTKSPKVKRKKVAIPLYCGGPGPCEGMLTITNSSRVYGSAPFTIIAGGTAPVPVKLNKAGLKQLRKGRGRLTIKATAQSKANKTSLRMKVKQPGA